MTDEFYDRLAADYHLLFADWDAALAWQSRVLEEVLRPHLGAGAWSLLDASCGIGTQALGLAMRGHRVSASDVSAASIARLRDEAASRSIMLTAVEVVDLRAMGEHLPGPFDAVISCDNALPHLLTDADLAAACAGLRARVRPGGRLLATIRDYDRILSERTGATMATPVRVIDASDGRRMVYQVWDWRDELYTVTQFILDGGPGSWSTRSFTGTYRALRRETLTAALRGAGLVDVGWHMPDETGYYQPLVLAQA